MAGGGPEPWRRTGRKAREDHYTGVEEGILLEIAVYDDHGGNQGRAVVTLSGRGEEEERTEGMTWLGKFLAIEDEYYQWWAQKTFEHRTVIFHLCCRPASRCSVRTPYREPVHVDVFRVLPGDSCLRLAWLKDEHKTAVSAHLVTAAVPVAPGATAPGGIGDRGGEPGGAVEEVQTGAAGIDGLARALDAGQSRRKRKDEDGNGEVGPEGEDPKRAKKKEGEKREQSLEEVLQERKAPAPELSALRLQSLKEDRKKKKKKKKKHKKRKSDKDSDDSSESSSTSSGSLFHLAAMPRGVEKIQRLHQEKPGLLANVTLKRFEELLAQTTGMGTATSSQTLPAVARGYFSQIFLVKHPESSIGLRNLRELRTLVTMIDHIANNDGLRALDVAVQRLKAIELFIAQGHWQQASQLELITPEGEQRAWFRQELRAAQQEHQAEAKLQKESNYFLRDRRPWTPPVRGDLKKDDKDDHPPDNQVKGDQKGKGKGKKGKRRFW